MTQKKWNKPPILKVSLRLQNVLYRLQRIELKQRADRATGLLQMHLKRAKKTNG